MRAGGCTVQQTLTSEAASVLKHSLSLARRRGHAQVTPLHVAATLLSSRVSLLRRACLKSHPHSSSHPLQCRALELCFNVALNRLPTSPSPLLHGQPSLSNALIAALKRAQAHQRRGCIEQQQQQPLLAIKVELEQLIISILDDPSVSRVMREAGFSSTNVKNNLEDSSVSSVFQCYSTGNPNSITSSEAPHTSFWQTHFLNCSSEQNPVFFSTPKKTLLSDSKEEDLRLVLEVLGRKKRRNTVIVGDSVSATEGLVAELMGRVERGEVPEELKSAHFIKFQFPAVSLRFMKREDVDVKVADLRRKVGSLVSGGGAIIYAGDLKWTVDASDHGGFSLGDHVPCYSPVDHLVAEIGRLLFDFSCSSNSKIWLVATANYQTYMRCQMKQPSLEIRWSLQAVSVPSSGLGLSLHGSSGLDSRLSISQNPSQMLEIKPFTAVKEEQDKLSCCAECTSNFEKDAVFLKSGQQKHSTLVNSCVKDMNKVSTDLPYWLQPHRADKDNLAELRRKWNRLCHSLHHSRSNQMRWSPQLFNNQSLSSKSYNSWWPIGSQCNQNNRHPDSSSISFADSTLKTNHTSDSAIQLGSQQPRLVEFGLGNGTQKNNVQLSLGCLKNTENTDEKITLALGTSLFSEKEKGMEELQKLLQENVPWQCEAMPSISKALLDPKASKKNGTWLLIQGDDWMGKRRVARAIVESFGGSGDQLVHMNMRREDQPNPCQTLGEALRKDRKCVVLIEGIDFADTQFLKFLSDGFNDSTSEESLGRGVSFSQAMFILTTGANEERKGTSDGIIHMKLHIEDSVESGHKRKAECGSPKESKYQRTSDEEDSISSIKQSEKVFSRQSSSNTLDLNILAEEEEDDNKSETDNFRSVSSDPDQKLLNGFLKSIKNRFVFNRNSAQLGQMTESFVSKLKGSFEEVLGGGMGGCFSVDQLVLEEMVNTGSGFFLASLFEKWLKDIFQTSLQMVKNGGKDKDKAIRLSFGGKVEEESAVEVGYMGSNLPKTIQVDLKE